MYCIVLLTLAQHRYLLIRTHLLELDIKKLSKRDKTYKSFKIFAACDNCRPEIVEWWPATKCSFGCGLPSRQMLRLRKILHDIMMPTSAAKKCFQWVLRLPWESSIQLGTKAWRMLLLALLTAKQCTRQVLKSVTLKYVLVCNVVRMEQEACRPRCSTVKKG